MITRTQLREVRKIITKHMKMLESKLIGGLFPKNKKMSKEKDIIKTAFMYGQLSQKTGKDLSKVPLKELKEMMNNTPLSKVESLAMDQCKIKTQEALNSLTQKVTSSAIALIIQSDLGVTPKIDEKADELLVTPHNKLVQVLRDSTQDYARDWDRIVQTDVWYAKTRGEVQSILDGTSVFTSKGMETEVFMRPSPTCCKKCAQVYLESDRVTPRVFKLRDLIANGTNYGKKQADWLPTLPPLHLYCQCTFNIKPPDTYFDEKGDLRYNKEV